MSEDLKSDRQRGVAAVEFAIVLPLLIFLFLGITEFGIAYYNKQVLTNASREGARVGIIHNTEDATIKQVAYDYAKDRLIPYNNNFSPESINIITSGEYIKVNAVFTYNYLVLSGFGFFGTNFGPNLDIVASTTMRMEP